ncbi:nuclease [Patescibacteria group bacterium]|nr:MAG: nuclease [Patescibacteria group bacterium]
MPHDAHHSLLRRLRTLQGAAVIIAVLILSLTLPDALRAPREAAPVAISGADAATGTPWTVSKVVDGDTIDVIASGEEVRIRLLGINTPESVDPRRPVECFGKEASAFAKGLLLGKTVRLEADPTQDDRDRYGRLLRHVFLEDGTHVNLRLVAEGYAHEYTYERAGRYQEILRDAERAARLSEKGLWNPDTCAGRT